MSAEVEATIIVVSHADWSAPVRLVDAAFEALEESGQAFTGVVSGGETYIFLPFEFEPPEESEAGGGSARLTIPNYALPIGDVTDLQTALRLLSTPVTISAAVISSIDPDAPLASFPAMVGRFAASDAATITVELVADLLAEEPLASFRYRPGPFPALDPTS